MKNIKLIVEYEGTAYSGWQKQNDVDTIEENVEKAIEKLTGEKTKLIASGRTDKGVHALGQVVNFKTQSIVPGENYKLALQEHLPDDITIVDSKEVDIRFHSRFDAKGKVYRYKVYNGKRPRALYRNFYYHYSYDIDLSKIREASKHLLGTHDFKSFMGRKCSAKSTVRTIKDISIEKEGDIVEFVIEGNSFLRYMVRIIVGTLLQIGTGKIQIEDISNIVDGRKRKYAGITAPAHGLYLEKVFYAEKHLDIDNCIY